MSAAMADVLDKAADLIEERGWWDGDEEDRSDYRLCAWQAIEAAADLSASVFLYNAAEVLGRTIPGLAGASDFCRIVAWNNALGRTAADVISTLRTVAVKVRAS